VTQDERKHRPFLVEAATLASEHYRHWMPPGLSEGEAVLSVDTCTSWTETATAHIQALDAFGAGMLLDALVQTATP